jgi:hypothetical protein
VPLLLRSLKKLELWKQDTETFAWVEPGDFAADLLTDLVPTHGGTLSVWVIEDDLSNLNRVIAAKIATKTNKDSVGSDFPYLLINQAAITDQGFELVAKLGDTPDEEANKWWHRDIVKLTGSKLFQLAHVLWHDKKLDEVADWDTIPLLKRSINDGHLLESALNKGVRAALAEWNASEDA